MGLNTGLVVVGAIGDNLRMDYSAVGDTTHLAARLQQAAAPGTILLSEATARLIEHQVALEPAGTLELRGLASPVTAFHLVGSEAPSSVLGTTDRWTRSRFVGRDREIATLGELFVQVEQGRGRVAGVVGEPGLGKSRLLLELRRAVGARARFLEGRCLSYGSAVPYLPILDLVRGACGIADVDPPERAADKVRATLDALGGEGRDRAPYLLHLLGLKEESDQDRLRELHGDVLMARTLDALRQLWLRTSRVLPLVLLVEDLHWIDAASEASLASLVESLGGARVLVVATYRPGYRPPWIDRSYATQISLGPLRRDESLDILRVLLPDLGSDDPLAALVLDRAEGNPFFLEELSHVVSDRAAGGLTVPDSVQGVLAARIDRLSERAKHVLLTASVLGREMTERLLRAVVDDAGRVDAALAELGRLELLHEKSEGDERAWVFKHALTQEVAHSMLVAGRRRALHRRAAEALAALYPERAGELHPRLAHHYLAAEAWAEAAEHARRAAEAAHRAWANREALARYDQAVLAAERAGLSAAARCRVLQARADVHATLGSFEPARADLEAALALSEQDGDAVAQGHLLTDLGARWGGHKDYARGLDLTRRAVDVLASAGVSQALAGARAQLGVMFLNLVRMTESRRELEAALALYRELDDAPGQGRVLEMLAMNLWLSGHVGSAVAAVEEALPKLAAAGDRRGEITALVGLGAARAWGDKMSSGRPSLERALAIALVLEARSDEAFVRCCVADFGMEAGAYGAAFRESSTALAIARELGHLEWTVYALDVLGRVHAECGAWAEARVLHEEELGLARRLGAALWIADALGNVGNDLLEAGDLDGARRYLEEAVQVAGECAEKAVHPLARLGDVAILAGRPRDALEASARLRATAGEYRVFVIQAKRIEAEAWALLGRLDEAEAALVDVIRQAERAEATPTGWLAELALAEVLISRGDQVGAREAAARALALVEPVMRELPPALSDALAASRLMRRIHRLAAD
jgi:tetratricopeptide (TPR) repeat protein